MKDFVSNNSSELIAEIPKNSREVIRVERSLFHGPTLANVRVWFRSEDGELRPSKRGIAIKVQQLSDLVSALQKVAS